MNYHNILHDDMRNGEGLRVVLFVSGCENHCDGCQNPQTWDVNSGIPFDLKAKEEIFDSLEKSYIDGLTLSGGDPLHPDNVDTIHNLVKEVRHKFPNKTIWIYTGYSMNYILNQYDLLNVKRKDILCYCDVAVTEKFEKDNADVNYHWGGSTNQQVINLSALFSENYLNKIKCLPCTSTL